jgi:hypothetical protein
VPTPKTESTAVDRSASGYVAPPPRELKRERKMLLQVREERLRDLGGLALEMYKRDRFSAGLVVERCAELVAIEARVQEIDSLLDGSARVRREGSALCVCGAPLLLGARFCATCGRAAGSSTRNPSPQGPP